jgi:hypothetical protein
VNYRPRNLLAPATALLLLGMQAGIAGTFRWVDEDGRVHYSDSVPAEKVRLGYKVYDGEGRQISVVEAAKTESERIEAERQATLAAEQERRDRALLATFTSEEDLEVARDERLATLDSAILLAEDKLTKLQAQAGELKAQAASDDSSRQPSQDVATRLKDLEANIGEVEADLAIKQVQRRAVEDAFASDLSRYRELKTPSVR